MSKVALISNLNSQFLASFQSFQKIDWKIKLCAGLVLGAASLVTYQVCNSRSFSSKTFQNAQLNFSDVRLSTRITFLQGTTGEKYEGRWTPQAVATYKPVLITLEFQDVLSQTLKILDENHKSDLPQIILSSDNESHKKIFEFLNLGVKGNYKNNPDTQRWIYIILSQLKKDHYIANFSISEDKITIDKIVK
ncbi:MAG: hypothetical protein JSS10_03740 [Verrucomicrobia bacterium]|nr:hypothetical protein [Verrucomicrobiota bacterium]